jgi:flagellar basal body L-ring protein FlgH
MRIIALLIFLLSFVSCSSYVNRIHKQISAEENGGRYRQARSQDPYARYRNRYNRQQDRRPIQNPKTLGGYANSANNRNYAPRNQRNYNSNGRTRASDLQDNSQDGSLWSSKNSESFLFVTNNIKKKGDIVIIEVMAKLKETIQDELKRTFPKKKSKKDTKNDEKTEGADKSATASSSATGGQENEVYDKISTQVVENVNDDYLLVTGQKEVFFRDSKRRIRLQGLVPKKNINDNDSIDSDSLLEPKITVLRY